MVLKNIGCYVNNILGWDISEVFRCNLCFHVKKSKNGYFKIPLYYF